MHPLLRLLDDMAACFRGYGQQLTLVISIVSTSLTLMSCRQHSREEAIAFAKHVHKALKAVEAGGAAKDYTLPTLVNLHTKMESEKHTSASHHGVKVRLMNYIGGEVL
jgi:hypothetical protein